MARRQKNQRKDKRFQVSLQLGVVNGKRQRVYFYGKSPEEAKQKRLDYIEAHKKSQKLSDKDITFGQWADRWVELYKSSLSDNTKDMYDSSVSFIKKFVYVDEQGEHPIKNMRMADILPYHLQALASSMDGKSKSYIRTVRQTMAQIFNAAIDNKIILNSPVVNLTFPSGTYSGHRALEEWEKKLIFTHWRLHRAGVWAMLMMYAGLRKGEVIALKWENINLGTKAIEVASSFDTKHLKTKGTKTEAGMRTVPIPQPLCDMLLEVKQSKGNVCLSADGKPLTEAAFRRGWSGFLCVLERAANDIKPYEDTDGWRRDIDKKKNENYIEVDFSAHDLRYTYATTLYDAGVEVKTAQLLMGHVDAETTIKIYTKLSKRTKQTSLDKLTAYFKDNQF